LVRKKQTASLQIDRLTLNTSHPHSNCRFCKLCRHRWSNI